MPGQCKLLRLRVYGRRLGIRTIACLILVLSVGGTARSAAERLMRLDAALTSLVKELRRVLRDLDGGAPLIKTTHGVGYASGDVACGSAA